MQTRSKQGYGNVKILIFTMCKISLITYDITTKVDSFDLLSGLNLGILAAAST